MYNDSMFNAFARSYEARNESDMSMAEYLESCRGDPMRYANAAIAICRRREGWILATRKREISPPKVSSRL